MEIDKEVLKGCIDTILMSLLNETPMYGYELAKKAREISKDTFEMKEGTLYLSLKRLEKNNYLESYWDDSESGGGRRKYYKITPIGKEYLYKKKEEWTLLNEVMNKFLGGI
ncbi:MAG: PadR family transcriptional regulator [Clostridium sp.]